MGRLDNSSEQFESDNLRSADDVLKTVKEDLRALQQGVIAELSNDIYRLQSEKSRLLREIEKLQAQHEMLQSEQQTLLSQRQLAQQQLWAKQLAQALAAHLQTILVQRLTPQGDAALAENTPRSSETAQRLLSSLDSTLNRTLTSVRQDLTSYQSALSQQISRMQTLEQQGEAILQALVNRLSQQLQTETTRHQSAHLPANGNGFATGSIHDVQPAPSNSPRTTVLPLPPPPLPQPAVVPGRPAQPIPTGSPSRSARLSQFQLGLLLILLSTTALSLHNVVVGIIGNPSSIFGVLNLGGYIRLNSLGNSLWILLFRMLTVVPIMIYVAHKLHPPTWREIEVLLRSQNRSLLPSVVGSGFFLFLSQVLIYIAIGQVGPGVAVTILFMYPIITVPLAWALFGDRPTSLRWAVMVAILAGVVLTAFPKLALTNSISWLGVSTAILSGVAFALYLIAIQISFRKKIHPVPLSVIQFCTILVLTSLSLLLPLNPKVQPDGSPGFLIGSIALGTLTLMGYLLNNFGVRYMGAARASIVAASGPVLTALLAFLILPGDPRTLLQGVQWLGIVVVTLGVVALSFERMLIQNRAAKAKA